MVAKKARTSAADDEVDQFELDDKLLAIEKLHELQEELELVNEEASEKVLEIEQQYNEKRKPVYAKRKEIINSIPNFWLTAFLSHPTLGRMLSEEDREIFTYLESLDLEDFNDVRKGYCITFNFKPNPFFENTKLTKTIKYFDEGTLRPTGSTIIWKEGKGPADDSDHGQIGNKRPLPDDSFFKWFRAEDPVEVEQDEVAELIKEELWPNPIEYLNNEDDEDDEDEEDNDGEDGSEPDV
ncbi:hypothetical protein BUALT_Bualt04G0146400 [Buddleja alternifolia]|uniref:Uncharacterized protein n=1 Tax=Buddleja alternifolia TaxID=168488 RepID=A0AAV6XQE4_9LAMI|nr:hypothetical protein BUALT_Bualt04G0146400 [Buddleja alternifolia]